MMGAADQSIVVLTSKTQSATLLQCRYGGAIALKTLAPSNFMLGNANQDGTPIRRRRQVKTAP